MTQDEAMRLVRETAAAVYEQVGTDLEAGAKELLRRQESNTQLREAFTLASHLLVEAQQAKKH
jgi:hypothetical protein